MVGGWQETGVLFCFVSLRREASGGNPHPLPPPPPPGGQGLRLTRQALEGYIRAVVQPEATGRADQLRDGTGCLLVIL